MSRYTPEQLREMARTALAARDTGSANWVFLVMTLSLRLALPQQRVEAEIERLAAS